MRCFDQRSTYPNGYRRRLDNTQVGDINLAIPKLRQGSYFPDWLEPRRRVDKALFAVVMEAYIGGNSTRKVDALVEVLGGDSGISKSEVSRISQGLNEQVKAFLGRPLDHAHFPYVYLDATYLHGRLGRNLQVVSRAVVVAIDINALGYREVLFVAMGDSEAEGFWRQFLGMLIAADCDDRGNPRSSVLTLRRPTRLPVVVFQKICQPGLMGPISKEASDLRVR